MADQPTTADVSGGAGEQLPPGHFNHELEQQRQSVARLLRQFASALRDAAPQRSIRHAARYVQEHYVERFAAGLDDYVGKRPAITIAAAFLAGYLAGRALRPR